MITRPLWESLFSYQRIETAPVCHALLTDPKFLALLLRIDHELAAQVRVNGCRCGGALHRADYPRKPRGCPAEVRSEHSSRLSFCCSVCRRRSTSRSVRFLGQRVYLTLAVVLMSPRPGGATSAQARLSALLNVSHRTLVRWRAWWHEQFPLTSLWRASCARFMPPLPMRCLPGELLERFAGAADEAAMPEVWMRLLLWLSPLTIRSETGFQGPVAIELHEVR